MSESEMTCRVFDSRIDPYLRSELDDEERADFERHLRACEECAALLELHLKVTCRQFVDVVADFLEGTLRKDESEKLAEHVGICPDCKTYLENYELTVNSLREPDEISPPPVDLVRALLNLRLRDSHPPS